ncbi:MAG: thiamine-phosphate pyrophosphorylase [Candidatus Omnitrophota bacterium]|jgi:thiamine-phosphate pyrophosphorylase
MKKAVFRIIDANLNRSREGLRVCEEITRFALNSEALTKELKSIRHSISNIAKPYLTKSGNIIGSRNSTEDVGRVSRKPSELKRVDSSDIFGANIERVKESLRVLEEFFKLIDKKCSVRFSRLRFKVYNIEQRSFKRLRRVK